MEMQGAAAAMGPLRGPGSKGSEGSEGSKGCGIAIGHALSGVKVQRVQKVHRVQRGWYRRFAAMSFIIPLRGMKNRTTGLRPLEMHPYPRLRRYFPPEGEVLAALCLEILMSPEAEWRANLPLRGRRRRQAAEGVHFRRPSGRLACFSRAKPGCMVFFPLLL